LPAYYLRGTVAGQRYYCSTGTSSEFHAEAIKAKLEKEAWDRHVFGTEATMNFAEAALSYLETKRPTPNTAALVDRLVAHFGERRLKKIDQAAVNAAYGAILRPGAKDATRLRCVLAPLRAILRHAGMTPNFHRPKTPPGRVRWIRPAEAERLIACCLPHLQPIVIFLLYTGARCSEVLELDWSEVDLAHGQATFLRTKNGHPRAVPLSPRVISELANLPHRDGRVFRKPGGRPYKDCGRTHGGQFAGAFKAACKAAEIKNLRPHDLRHTWATWLYAEKKDLLLLKQLGGWKSFQMVERYAHVDMETHRPAIDALPGANLVQKEKKIA